MNITTSEEAIDRERVTVERSGYSRSGMWLRIQQGLFPRPIRIPGTKRNGWPRSETQAVIRATIAGATDDEIRALVAEMVSRRRAPMREAA